MGFYDGETTESAKTLSVDVTSRFHSKPQAPANRRRKLVLTPVSVEKVPQLMLVAVQGSSYK
jgi:hypothetical protein